MSRDEKIADFMRSEWGGQRWCTAKACACLGCINGSLINDWKKQNPGEAPIKKEEFEAHKEEKKY